VELLTTLSNWALIVGVPAVLLYQYKLYDKMSHSMDDVRVRLGSFVPREEVDYRINDLRKEIRDDLLRQEHRIEVKFVEHRSWSELQFKDLREFLVRIDDRTAKKQ